MEKMVFFNIAWMEYYEGITPADRPLHGGGFVEDKGWGAEVYNFQPYGEKLYGFVEAGWQRLCNIRIEKLGALRLAQSVPGVLIVWVAKHPDKAQTVVVGWYRNGTVYRKRQKPPAGSNRRLPDGEDAPYFAVADEAHCTRIPADMRDFAIPRGKDGIGQNNIWYGDSMGGKKAKAKVLQYISNWRAGEVARLKVLESKAEVYLMALQSLSKAEKEAVIARLLEDAKLREDILDLALMRQRQGEPSRPFKDYLAERKKRTRKG